MFRQISAHDPDRRRVLSSVEIETGEQMDAVELGKADLLPEYIPIRVRII